jgi:hypothetical protein
VLSAPTVKTLKRLMGIDWYPLILII